MAVKLSVDELASAIRITLPLNVTLAARLESLLEAATAMVQEYAGAAPTEVQNEAVIRICGYMHDNDPARNRRFSDVLAVSGAAGILGMFRVQRAIAI